MVPEYGYRQVRELIEAPYRILYRLTAEGVEIVTVFHGSMKLE